MKICFIGRMVSKFTKRDFDILAKEHEMLLIDSDDYAGTSTMTQILAIVKAVRRSDLVFSWFAGKYSAIAVVCCKLFNKKSVIVAGGYDVVYRPDINYGAFISARGRLNSTIALEHADFVVSISKSNQRELLEKLTPKKNVLIYNGVPVDEFYGGNKKESMILTVGEVSKSNWKRKGLDNFVAMAEYFHENKFKGKFVICGQIQGNMIRKVSSINLPNLKFTGWVPDSELLRYYQRAKIYLQLSRHEGFGISVAEAMLCECIPIVSDQGALPELIGECGIVAPECVNLPLKATTIKYVLNDKIHADFDLIARSRIIYNFSLKKREEELLKLLRYMA